MVRVCSHAKKRDLPIVMYGGKKRQIINKAIFKKPIKKNKFKFLQDIIKYQTSTELLIPRAPFVRLVHEITENLYNKGEIFDFVRYQSSALDALHKIAEDKIITLMAASQLCAIHAKRIGLIPEDMQLVNVIKNNF